MIYKLKVNITDGKGKVTERIKKLRTNFVLSFVVCWSEVK
jgi:hypothetical protein